MCWRIWIRVHFKEGFLVIFLKKVTKMTTLTIWAHSFKCHFINYGKSLNIIVEKKVHELEQHSDFRAIKSCMGNIYTIKLVTDKWLVHNLDTYLIYIDLCEAYDFIEELWYCVFVHRSESGKLRCLCMPIYRRMCSLCQAAMSKGFSNL